MSNLHKAIVHLRDELARIDGAIAQLERLENSEPSVARVSSKRGRKSMGAAERKQVSERIRKYWAGRRNQAQ